MSSLPDGELHVQIATEDDFRSLREDWNGLLARSASTSVFLRWEWIHTWWEIFRKQRALFLITVRQGRRLVGIAPFYIEPASSIGERRLRFCSDDLSPDYLDVIAEKGLESAVLRKIAGCVKRRANEWDVMAVDYLLADSVLLTGLPHEGLLHRRGDSLPCPYISIQGSFEEYLQSRPGLSLLRLRKKMTTFLGKSAVRYDLVKDMKDLPKGIDDLFFLHKMRSQSSGRRTDFASSDVELFHHRLGALFLEQGILELRLLYDGGTPVDAHYSFRYGNKLFNYQQGFNPAYKNWSVGTMSLCLELREVFARGLSEYDFLKGEESYKFLWSTGVRRQYSLKAYAPTRRGSIYRAKDGLIASLKSVKAAFRKTQPSTLKP